MRDAAIRLRTAGSVTAGPVLERQLLVLVQVRLHDDLAHPCIEDPEQRGRDVPHLWGRHRSVQAEWHSRHTDRSASLTCSGVAQPRWSAAAVPMEAITPTAVTAAWNFRMSQATTAPQLIPTAASPPWWRRTSKSRPPSIGRAAVQGAPGFLGVDCWLSALPTFSASAQDASRSTSSGTCALVVGKRATARSSTALRVVMESPIGRKTRHSKKLTNSNKKTVCSPSGW
eukprot:2463858-Prymnesium_polylepis.1